MISEVCRDLFKGTSLTSIAVTGHVVKPTTGKNHGYTVEAKGQPWVYSLKDKTETKVNHQNFAPKHVLVVEACFKRSGYCQFLSARGLSCLMCDPSQVRSLGESGAPALANGFSWAWRFTFDSVHGKLTARKPYLVVDADLKLEKGKAIRVTKTQG